MNIVNELKSLKEYYIKDGFIIDAIFGSVARGEKEYRDLDLLYHLDKEFLLKYRGFKAFKKLEEIKESISKKIGIKVDLAPSNNLSKTAKKYILKDAIYV